MKLQKKLVREIFFFLGICGLSLLFWVVIALITDQKVIAPEYLYVREKNAFLGTVALVYFLRLNVRQSDRRRAL